VEWSSEVSIDKSHTKSFGQISQNVQAVYHRFSCYLGWRGYCSTTSLGSMSVISIVTSMLFLMFSPSQGGGIGWTGPVSNGQLLP